MTTPPYVIQFYCRYDLWKHIWLQMNNLLHNILRVIYAGICIVLYVLCYRFFSRLCLMARRVWIWWPMEGCPVIVQTPPLVSTLASVSIEISVPPHPLQCLKTRFRRTLYNKHEYPKSSKQDLILLQHQTWIQKFHMQIPSTWYIIHFIPYLYKPYVKCYFIDKLRIANKYKFNGSFTQTICFLHCSIILFLNNSILK